MTKKERDKWEQLRDRCIAVRSKLAISLRNSDHFTLDKLRQHQYLEEQIKLINNKLKEQ